MQIMLRKNSAQKVELCLGSIYSLLLITSFVLAEKPVLASDNSLNSNSLDNDDQGHCSSYDQANNETLHFLSARCLLSARKMSGTQPVPNDDLIPSWANLTLFSVGQDFARRHIGYLGISHLFALIFENFIPDIKDVLITTGSTTRRERAIKRYTATAAQVILWYRNSLDDPVERENLFQSLRNVRRLHLDGAVKAILKMKKNRDKFIESRRLEILQELWSHPQVPPSIVFDERYWQALETDLLTSDIPEWKRHYPKWNDSGPPISQFAQSLTQFSFAGLPVLFHKEFGISHVTREELEGYVHMWAVLGHAIGIQNEFNICKNENFEETIKLFRDILNSYFIPAMFQLDWRVRVQLGSYLDALRQMDQIITPRLITYRFLRDMLKIPATTMFRQMNIIERMYLPMIDGLMSSNLEANRFFLNRGGMFFLDVNGYDHFGSDYNSDARKSKGAFYTRDKLEYY